MFCCAIGQCSLVDSVETVVALSSCASFEVTAIALEWNMEMLVTLKAAVDLAHGTCVPLVGTVWLSMCFTGRNWLAMQSFG